MVYAGENPKGEPGLREPARVAYLVAPTIQAGIEDGRNRAGWTQIAYTRFATEDRMDIRVIDRIRDCIPIPGGTKLYKGKSYDEATNEDWADKRQFESFIESGAGKWIE